MKKAPETGASESNFALLQGVPKLLLLLRSSFFLRGSLFGCALHRLILPNIKFCDLEKPQCDSYIRFFTTKVKKKMHADLAFDLSPSSSRRIEREISIVATHLEPARASYILWTRFGPMFLLPLFLAFQAEGETDLIRSLQRRDPHALADLYHRYGRLAYSLILRVVRDTGVAEDLVQETFLRVWNRAQGFDAEKGALG